MIPTGRARGRIEWLKRDGHLFWGWLSQTESRLQDIDTVSPNPLAGSRHIALFLSDGVLVRRYWEQGWNTGNTVMLDDIVAPDVVFHNTDGTVAHGIEKFKEGMTRWRTEFPDSHITIDDIFAAGVMVTVRWTGQVRSHTAGR